MTEIFKRKWNEKECPTIPGNKVSDMIAGQAEVTVSLMQPHSGCMSRSNCGMQPWICLRHGHKTRPLSSSDKLSVDGPIRSGQGLTGQSERVLQSWRGHTPTRPSARLRARRSNVHFPRLPSFRYVHNPPTMSQTQQADSTRSQRKYSRARTCHPPRNITKNVRLSPKV